LNKLVAYRASQVTEDTAEALRQLELAAKEQGGVRIHYDGVSRAQMSWDAVRGDPGPTQLPPPLSFRSTGREVGLRVEVLEGSASREAEIAALWALAVPRGFIPWTRYPVPGAGDEVFHYLGPWAALGDFLQGEGRGDQTWPSMCAAAQCEVGTWEGGRAVEHLMQTHLHRLGIHCGPVDGFIGERTLSSLRALGLGGLTMADAVASLQKMTPPTVDTSDVQRAGHFSIEGSLPEAFTSGKVNTIRTQTGYAVAVDGPGRLIFLFGESQ
jgi:hypothetical protein